MGRIVSLATDTPPELPGQLSVACNAEWCTVASTTVASSSLVRPSQVVH